MESLRVWELGYCALVVVMAFAVRGGTGFGGGALAVPLLALVLPLPLAVPVIAILNMFSSIGHGIRDWRHIVWADIWRVMPFTLVGVAIGIYLLAELDPKPLSRSLGAFVIAYAAFSFFIAGRLPALAPRWRMPLAAATGTGAGFIGALFGGAAGLLYVIYLNAVKMPKDSFRVTITTIMLFQGIVRIGGYAGLGLYTPSSFVLLAAALPMMLLGSYIGERVVRRFDQRRFERLIGGVLVLSGAALLLK